MKGFKIFGTILFLLVSGCLFANEINQKPSLRVVSSLADPTKLEALKAGNRAANQRFRKFMFYLHEAESAGVAPKDYLTQIYALYESEPYVKATHVFAPVTERKNLEAQYRLGKFYGLFTPSNLILLKRGRAPVISRGDWKGDKAEVDHIIAYKLAPALERSMANLAWLPETVNRRKSDTFTNAAKRRSTALFKETGWKLSVSE